RNNASYAGTIFQSLTINDNTVSNVTHSGIDGSGGGIFVSNFARYDSTISQALIIDPNTVLNVTNGVGIGVRNFAYDSYITQHVTIACNFVSATGGDGLFLMNVAGGDGIISQTGAIISNSVTGAGDDGLSMFVSAYGG